MASGDVWSTSELTFAAFIFMRSQSQADTGAGVKFDGADRKASGRFEFRFTDPNGICEKWVMDFTTSESQRYDSAMTTLKKLVTKKR